MRRTQNLNQFACDFCQKLFDAEVYGSIWTAQRKCLQHECICKGIPQLMLGDVVIFNDFDNVAECNNEYFYQTPPLFVKHIIRHENCKEYHCTFVKIDIYKKTWYEDKQYTEKWFRNSEIKYFIFFDNQINRKLNMKDFFNSHKYLEEIKKLIDTNHTDYSDKKSVADISANFKQNYLELNIKMPYKYER